MVLCLFNIPYHISVSADNVGYYEHEYNVATTTDIQASAKVGGTICFATMFLTNDDAYKLTRISLLLSQQNNVPYGTITIALRNSTGPIFHRPTGPNLTVSPTTLDATTITNWPVLTWYNFSFSNYQLEANTEYAICTFMHDGINVSGEPNYIKGISDHTGVGDVGVRNCNVFATYVSENGGDTWIGNSLYEGSGTNQFKLFSDVITINNTNPTNGSTDVDLLPLVCAEVNSNNPSVHSLTWEWYNISSSSWIQFDNQTLGSYNYSKEIQINNNDIDTWLHDFPVLVNISSNDFKDTANGGPIATDGTGISFWNQGNTTRYYHELEYYNGTTGHIVAWVNITDINPGINTRFYIWYGDLGDLSNPTAVWDDSYAGVWHMNDSYYLWDSTGNNNHGIRKGNPTNTTSLCGPAIAFDGTADMFNISEDDSLNVSTNPFTVFLRFSTATYDVQNRYPFIKRRYSGEGEIDFLFDDNGGAGIWASFRVFEAPAGVNFINCQIGAGGVPTFNDDYWHSMSGRVMAGGVGRFAVDETTIDGYTDAGLGSPDGYPYWFSIGGSRETLPDAMFIGNLDEVRFCKRALNDSYLNATHSNLNSSLTFLTYGSEEEHSGGSGYINGTYCATYENATSCGTTYNWRINVSDGLGNWSNETFYFTTLSLEPPSSINIKRNSSTSVNLTWTNYSVPGGIDGNLSTYVRYSTSEYPTTRDEGTFGDNTSNETTIIDGLLIDGDYYFSLWTHYEKNGSGCWSPAYAPAFSSTSGGEYNITFAWECTQEIIADTEYGGANYTNLTLTHIWGVLIDGTLINDTYVSTNSFIINFDISPDVIYVDWAGLGMVRAITPFPGQRNLTFYICCEPEYEEGMNLSDSQLFYTFHFDDYTPNSLFTLSPETKLYIYDYNMSLGKYYIHQDFWSAEDTVYVALEYGERYYIGLDCDALNISFLQYVDTGTNQHIYINILPHYNDTFVITQLASKTLEWQGSNGFCVNYTDIVVGTNSATIRIYIYYSTNDTYLLVKTKTFDVSEYSYFYTTALGCDVALDYFVTIEISHVLFTINQTITGFIFAFPPLGASADWINGAFISVLGICPLNPVTWTQSFAFGIFFIFLVSLGAKYGELGVITASIVLIFIETIVLDDIAVRGLVVGVAIFLIITAAIMYIGSKRSYT